MVIRDPDDGETRIENIEIIPYAFVQSVRASRTEDDDAMLALSRQTAIADGHSRPEIAIGRPTGHDDLLVAINGRVKHEFAGDRLNASDGRQIAPHVLGDSAGKNIGSVSRQNGQVGAFADAAIDAVR